MLVNAIDRLEIENPLSEQIRELGFETFNPILNLGGLFILIGAYFLQLGVLLTTIVVIKLLIWQMGVHKSKSTVSQSELECEGGIAEKKKLKKPQKPKVVDKQQFT